MIEVCGSGLEQVDVLLDHAIGRPEVRIRALRAVPGGFQILLFQRLDRLRIVRYALDRFQDRRIAVGVFLLERGMNNEAALRPGDRVVVGTATGRVAYVVEAVHRYPKAGLPAEVFATTGPPRLVLITCGGDFDPRTRHYAENVVVYAIPIATEPPS